ncbi:hypothetical protein [Nodularia sphaerocarpa]|uniref:hypothetical protein n=1 Tax=Nodularia sphaerocarpa TaxID=137816 RepID=UPI001EFBC1DB|nr:hypothetical protein [Nodularia sphaerocarpa]MDB9374451.1 hypothetical protein [Nodularia sphaerocarpa CS-585]ULP72568.1 hypothetical protein BDGGKGIB_02212 [Nodularia sphaerocarpa UHCC 0038]
MSIPNERESKNSEVKQESYTDTNGNTHTHRKRTTQTNLATGDNNNVLLGIIVTSLLSLIVGGVWYFNQSNKAEVDNTVPIVAPVPNNSTPTPSVSPQAETKIIEKTREVPVFVPVPQQQVIPSSPPRQPDINITVPPQQPAAEKAPSPPRQPDINITVPPQQPAAEKTPSATPPNPKATPSPTSPTNNTPTSQNEDGTSTKTVTPSTKNDTSNNGSSTAGDTTTGGSGQ